MEMLEELKHDFKDALSDINFKRYDPYSREFMKALFIGQVWMAAKYLEETDDVEEELEGAKTYYDMYTKTGDAAYRDMASDELRHAGILIKKHMAKADDKQKQILMEHEAERQKMLKWFEKEE